MVTCIPEAPKFVTSSEREVWELLREQLRPEDVLVANQRFTTHARDYELDLFVLMPGFGIVGVEVKGGSVSHDGTGWLQRRRGDTVRIDPVGQVRAATYAAREYVGRDPRWAAGDHVRWGYAVVFPYTDVDPDFSLPDAPRWLVNARGDLKQLGRRLRSLAAEQEGRHRVPERADVELVADILRGRNRPELTVAAEADDREAEADRLTQEQLLLLKVTRLLNRVEVRGGAGSGKTVMALTHARQLAHGRDGIPGQRVALVCYSRGLAAYFRRVTSGWGRREKPAFVGTFEEWGLSWGAEPVAQWRDRQPGASGGDTPYYEDELPQQMAVLAREISEGKRFDAVIVDEAQDFAEAWWQPVLGALKDEESGGLYLYTDANQRVFQRFGEPPVPLVPLVLDHNLRNTTQIGQVINPLAPHRMRLLGGSGPEVTFVPCGASEALAVADDHVDALLDEGWRERDVALLTVGSRHPVQKDLAEVDPEAYWSSFWDDETTFYGHVLGCKGLERKAVVLCVNKDTVNDRDREKLYVGLSRATDRLVVVGDPAYLESVCGPEVAKRLGIGSAQSPDRTAAPVS